MPPLGKEFFGLHVAGPIETNDGGLGVATPWPTWRPTGIRTFAFAPPYTQVIGEWAKIEPAPGAFNWNIFDAIWPKYVSSGVTDLLMPLSNIPQWAMVGNAYSFPCTLSSGSPCIVTAPSNNYVRLQQVFFSGGTLPDGIEAGRLYYPVKRSGDTFQLSNTFRGQPINTSGSAGSSTVTMNQTIPTDLGTISAYVTGILTRAKQNGLAIKYVEGFNEPSSYPANGFNGSISDLVLIQLALYNAAKAFDPTIQVLCPPINSLALPPQTYLKQFLDAGGGAFCDIIGYHGYQDNGLTTSSQYQARLKNFMAMVSSEGLRSKQIWNTEFGVYNKVGESAKWLSTTMLIALSAGVARTVHYGYDVEHYELWDHTISPSGGLTAAGIAYTQMVSWLLGATLTQAASKSGLIWTCGIGKANDYAGLAVWTDNDSTSLYLPPKWATHYRDLAGNLVHLQNPSDVTINGNPILFEN